MRSILPTGFPKIQPLQRCGMSNLLHLGAVGYGGASSRRRCFGPAYGERLVIFLFCAE